MSISQKGQLRYDSFVETGLELFLQNGYEGTSLNDIVNKSGGSLASIYKFFNNKEGLFLAILDKKFEDFQKELDKAMSIGNSDDTREFLNKFGLTYFNVFYKTDAIKFSRIIISEGYRNKNLGKMLYESIICKTMSLLAAFFDKDCIKKLIKTPEELECPDRYPVNVFLAQKFCALIREPFYTDALLIGDDTIKSMSKKKKEALIASMVNVFMDGIYKSSK